LWDCLYTEIAKDHLFRIAASNPQAASNLSAALRQFCAKLNQLGHECPAPAAWNRIFIASEFALESVPLQTSKGSIHVSGRIDTGTAADAERKLTAEVRQGRRVVLDMTLVPYVSSAGLRVVLMTAKLAKANRGAVSLFGLQSTVREVFTMSGFDKVVTICDDESAALAALAG
jgi:anti-anti-sigma factor